MTLSPERRGRITASAVGGILGLSPYQTPEDVLRRMVRDWHGAQSEFTGNVATEYGTFYESLAIQDFEMVTGITVKKADFYKFSDWLGATPDGFFGINESEIIEVKCPYGIRNDKPPVFKLLEKQQHYYAQIQIQLLCTTASVCYFCQWTPYGHSIEVVYVDKPWLETNMPLLRDFYNHYLSERDNPAHLEPKRKVIETQRMTLLLAEYDELSERIDISTERKSEILSEIVTIAGNKNASICGRNLTKIEKDGAISYSKAIKALLPNADLEPYRGKPSEYWRLG